MVTIVLPISRKTFIKEIFECLENLDCKPEQTSLFVYIDGDLSLYEVAHRYVSRSKFIERLCVYRKKGLPNVGNIRSRRKRIADIHNEIRNYISNTDFVFLLEDDTLFPPDTLSKLLLAYVIKDLPGIVSGVELGRWGFLHIGAWVADSTTDPRKITSISKTDAIVPIDATGLYCCLIRADLYLNHTFKPFQDILGPDVDFGFELRNKGYINYACGSIHCVHLTPKERIEMSSSIIRVTFEKQPDNKWKLIQE